MYDITIIRNDKVIEQYKATEYKTIKPRGMNNCIPKEKRTYTRVKIKPEGKNRYKHYSKLWESIIIKDLEKNEIVLNWECTIK